jgi:hypothetical protein
MPPLLWKQPHSLIETEMPRGDPLAAQKSPKAPASARLAVSLRKAAAQLEAMPPK